MEFRYQGKLSLLAHMCIHELHQPEHQSVDQQAKDAQCRVRKRGCCPLCNSLNLLLMNLWLGGPDVNHPLAAGKMASGGFDRGLGVSSGFHSTLPCGHEGLARPLGMCRCSIGHHPWQPSTLD